MPSCPRANLALASLLSTTNRASFAAEHFSRAARVDGRTADLVLREANNVYAQAKMREAAALFEEAAQFEENGAAAWAGWLACLDSEGDLTEAATVADRAKQKFGADNADLRRALAALEASRKNYDGAVALLPTGSNLRPMELFDRGRYFDKLGEYDKAWSDWMTAKALLRTNAGHAYQEAALTELVSGMKDATLAHRWDYATRTAVAWRDRPEPIFITGFPRSGTTLMETILASHPKISPGDELNFVPELTSLLPRLVDLNVPYPASLGALSFGNNAHVATALADHYMVRAGEKIVRDGHGFLSADRFTDKMPLNELHLPFLRFLFPRAHMVHMQRHPLDIVLSSMSYYITHGFYYASSLAAAASAFVMIDGLLQDFKKKFGQIGSVVRYETLVSDQETETRCLMGAIGLDMAPAQLRPHELARHSRTISHHQVRQPIYTASVYRYKNYRKHLAPILAKLAPICEREGYEI